MGSRKIDTARKNRTKRKKWFEDTPELKEPNKPVYRVNAKDERVGVYEKR